MPFKKVKFQTEPRGMFGKVRTFFKKVFVEEETETKKGFDYSKKPEAGTNAAAIVREIKKDVSPVKAKTPSKKKADKTKKPVAKKKAKAKAPAKKKAK